MENSDREDTEDSLQEIETSLSSLKLSANAAEDAVTKALNRLKLAQHKLKIEMEELSETELRSKPLLRAWLSKRGLPTDSSFQVFFQAFLDEHKQEHRLDLSDRTVTLNKDGTQLLGYKESNKRVSILEIMERLPLLFH